MTTTAYHVPLDATPPADTFIQKTKKLYADTRTQRNMTKLTDELSEVHSIMTRNIQEVLGQGQQLDGGFAMGRGMREQIGQRAQQPREELCVMCRPGWSYAMIGKESL